ncbi:PhoH family protein [Atopobacter phocae]|uniref:PhoH family protein n=1 Tax=Atopobacter phocae TaxID=136492 RepID=UPI0004706318|nr:PhoH family protein [Atopobacter phocae]
MQENNDLIIELKHPELLPVLLGPNDRHLILIEQAFKVELFTRGETITVLGDASKTSIIRRLLNELETLIASGITLAPQDIVTAIKMAEKNTLDAFLNLYRQEIGRTHERQPIRPKTAGQQTYINGIRKHDLTIGVGPAGTGKTFLAVVLATTALRQGEVKKIILTRPAVEAGENLGFLPGDLKEKVDPYLRPLYDALYTIYGIDHTERLMERGVIEIAPLAYMRGRTLNDAFIILDEAQNTTTAQMRMFLTRLGFGSKMVVNGDITQIDLPAGQKSGLIDAWNKLEHLKRVSRIKLSAEDVIRHPLVADIINAYSQLEKKKQQVPTKMDKESDETE